MSAELPAGFKIVTKNSGAALPAGFKVITPKPSQQEIDKALSDSNGAFIAGAGQMFSGNLGDEMLAGMGAGFAGTVLTGTNALGLTDVESPYQSTYDSGLERRRKVNTDAQEAAPLSYGAGQLAGGVGSLLSGGALVKGATEGTKLAGALSATNNVINKAGLVGRMAKGAAAGAAYGEATGFGRGEGGFDNRMATAEEDAILNAKFGAALPVVGKVAQGVYSVGKSATRGVKDVVIPKAPVLSYEEVAAMSSAKYAEADKLGGILKPEITDKWLKKIQGIQRISPQAQPLQTATEKEIFNSIDELVSVNKGQPLSLQAAQDIDERLGERISALYKDGLPKKANALSDAQLSLRESIENATDADVIGGKGGFEALKEGRFLFSRSRALRDIERVIENAAMYDQPATAIKTGLRTIARNPKRMRGFNKEERLIIKKAAESSAPMDLLRTMGSRLNPIIAMGATGNPAYAVATKVGSDLSRSAGEALQARRAGKVLQSISDDVRGIKRPVTANSTPFIPTPSGAVERPTQQSHLLLESPSNRRPLPDEVIPMPDGTTPQKLLPYYPSEPTAPTLAQAAPTPRAIKTPSLPRAPRINTGQIAQQSKDTNLSAIDDAFYGQLPDDTRETARGYFRKRDAEKQELLEILKSINAPASKMKSVSGAIDRVYAGKVNNVKELDDILQQTNWSKNEKAPRTAELIKNIYKNNPREMRSLPFSDKPIEYQMRRPDGGITNYRINPTIPSFLEFKARMAKLPKDRFVAIGGAGVAGAYSTDSNASPPPLTLEITPQSNTFQYDGAPLGNDFTQQEEGFRDRTYLDSTNNPTIGYGFNFNSGIAPRVWKEAGIQTSYKQAKYGKAAITPDEAIALYRTSKKIAADDARSYYPDFDRLNPRQQTALTDVSYQMGLPTLQQFSGLKKAIKTGNVNAIISSIRKSKYYTQTPERADRVIQLLIAEK